MIKKMRNKIKNLHENRKLSFYNNDVYIYGFFMSIYNVVLHLGSLSMETIKNVASGFPLAFVVGMLCDWIIVSRTWLQLMEL